jgi:hypothetical protein
VLNVRISLLPAVAPLRAFPILLGLLLPSHTVLSADDRKVVLVCKNQGSDRQFSWELNYSKETISSIPSDREYENLPVEITDKEIKWRWVGTGVVKGVVTDYTFERYTGELFSRTVWNQTGRIEGGKSICTTREGKVAQRPPSHEYFQLLALANQ